ncbi:hypothetical protein KCU85_g8972, partial [Aureobasidium melanogenum]
MAAEDLSVQTVQMASALPTITTPLRPDPSSQAYYDKIGEAMSQARRALDRIVREFGLLNELETTVHVTGQYDDSPHTTFEARATLLEVLNKEVNALKRWLEELQGLVQGALEDSMNIASTTTTTGVVDEKRRQEWALPGSRARYMVVVLLLSASLLATLFALFFVSTQK